MHPFNRFVSVLVLVTFAATVLPWAAIAQDAARADYRVGANDRLFLSVPQRPDLNRELVVRDDGSVLLPLIGAVSVRGLTVREIEEKLLQTVRDYYPSVSRVQVTLTEAVSQIIYVSGQVRLPGKFNFANKVNVWEAIREAGGPLPNASLDNVRIVKDRSRGGTSVMVNVLSAIEGGSVENLPELEAGDTIIVPTIEEVYTGSFGVNVFGAVVLPGVYRLQAREDLVSAILQAGGPVDFSQLKDVRIIRPRADGTVVTVKVNLNNFLKFGDPLSNPKLLPGDTVYVPRKSRLVELATTDARTMLGVVTALATTTLLFLTIRDQAKK